MGFSTIIIENDGKPSIHENFGSPCHELSTTVALLRSLSKAIMFFKISVIAIASSQCVSFGLSIPQYSAPIPTPSAATILRDAPGYNIPRAAEINVPALRHVNSDELPQLANLKRAPSGFKHPGVFLDSKQLNFIKSMVSSEA